MPLNWRIGFIVGGLLGAFVSYGLVQWVNAFPLGHSSILAVGANILTLPGVVVGITLAFPGLIVIQCLGSLTPDEKLIVLVISNGIAYGLVGIPVANLIASWRRRRRRRHGLCATCRYDLIGNKSGICPECGTKIEVM